MSAPAPAAELTAVYLPPLTLAMLLSNAVQPGPCPETGASTSMVYVVTPCALCFMKRAHSSLGFACEPVGDSPICVVLPPAAASIEFAFESTDALSWLGPLLM